MNIWVHLWNYFQMTVWSTERILSKADMPIRSKLTLFMVCLVEWQPPKSIGKSDLKTTKICWVELFWRCLKWGACQSINIFLLLRIRIECSDPKRPQQLTVQHILHTRAEKLSSVQLTFDSTNKGGTSYATKLQPVSLEIQHCALKDEATFPNLKFALSVPVSRQQFVISTNSHEWMKVCCSPVVNEKLKTSCGRPSEMP